MVEWGGFLAAMMKRFPGKIGPTQSKQLQSILGNLGCIITDGLQDNANTGFVSQYKMSEFLKGFGPFESCVDNVVHLLAQPYHLGSLIC